MGVTAAGLTATMAVMAHALNDNGRTPWFVMLHAGTVLLVLTGCWRLWSLPPLTSSWLRLSQAALAAAALQIYMIPFVSWWQRAPASPFLALNVLAAVVGLAWLLAMLGALVAEAGKAGAIPALMAEGALCVWIAPLLLLFPVAYTLGRILLACWAARIPLQDWPRMATSGIWPGWTATSMLLAPGLAMMVLLEARWRWRAAMREARQDS